MAGSFASLHIACEPWLQEQGPRPALESRFSTAGKGEDGSPVVSWAALQLVGRGLWEAPGLGPGLAEVGSSLLPSNRGRVLLPCSCRASQDWVMRGVWNNHIFSGWKVQPGAAQGWLGWASLEIPHMLKHVTWRSGHHAAFPSLHKNNRNEVQP